MEKMLRFFSPSVSSPSVSPSVATTKGVMAKYAASRHMRDVRSQAARARGTLQAVLSISDQERTQRVIETS